MTATTVRLGGTLGNRFGREFKLHLDTQTSAEALRALCCLVDGFASFLASASDRGIEFAIFRGRGKHAENIGYEQLCEPAGGDVRIMPVHAGAKNSGVLQTIVGAVLIIVGAFTSWFTGPVGAAMVSAGIGMVAGGIVQMLSPQPKLNKAGDAADNQASYIFNGPVNTTAQGVAVPVLYGGPMEIGSMVMSAGIEAVDYSSRPSTVGNGSTLGNAKTSPYDPD